MEDGLSAMETDQELLPSTLYSRFKANNTGKSALDHESLLVDLLSLLSTLEDIGPQFCSRNNESIDHGRYSDIVAWISNQTKVGYPPDTDDNPGTARKQEKGSLFYEWSKALVYIHDLSQHIAPFELHFLASQSIFLSDDATASHRILCLILCTHALQQCPDLRKRRWKRWQSLVCETLRMFQDSIDILDNDHTKFDTGTSAFSLWIHHVVPSCLHVVDQLPLDAYHVAIFCGLVGTSSNILGTIVARCQEERKGTNDMNRISSYFLDSLCTVHASAQSIIETFSQRGIFSANTLWIESTRQPLETEVNRNEDADFWMHRNTIAWWIHHRQNHEPEERIANMDTSFDDTGMGLLAMKAFQERPLVYDPRYVWTIWCPHVVVVFRKSAEYPSILQSLAFQFLESLVEILAKESLVPEKTMYSTPDAHLELFHLLSNQLMSRVKTKSNEEGNGEQNSSLDEETEFNERSRRTVALIKALLSRFTTTSQVQIIEKVIQTCSSPGLKARFLDLLRPLILVSDPKTERLLWKFLVSIVQDLFQKFWNRQEQVLINIDDLIGRDVEISVGAITMIQMWSLAEGKVLNQDQKAIGENLQGFRVALQKLLERWSEDPSLAPEFHFRLFLLDLALQNTCESLLKMK